MDFFNCLFSRLEDTILSKRTGIKVKIPYAEIEAMMKKEMVTLS